MSKMPKRKLTPFLCQELLYDYAIDTLDPERKAAVEEFLQENPESQRTLEVIRRGFAYADQLSRFEVNPALVERLTQSESIATISKKVSAPRQWPDSLRWSLIAILASACIALVISLVPWAKFKFGKNKTNNVVELAPLQGEGERAEGEPHVVSEPANEASGDFDESGKPVEDEPLIVAPPAAALKKPVAKPISVPPALAPKGAAATPNSLLPVLPGQVNTLTPGPTAGGEAVAPSTPAPANPAAPAAKPQGYVYRAFMDLRGEDDSENIRELIVELGGSKAGEVDLGWKRGSLRYFHFTLPEASEQVFLERLRAYGPVRISKDPHPRVMPRGQVRFILSIDTK